MIDKQASKDKILDLVKEYVKEYHLTETEFHEGDRISYAGRVYDEEEVCNLVDSALDFWLTSGEYCQKFEKEFAKYLNVKYCSLVNSGSSANLLAFMALTSPLLKDRQIKRGDEVITVAAGFPTTVSPIINYGAVPVFVDIALPTYNLNVELLEQALSSKTKAVMLAHTLGNPFDLKEVKLFCEKHNLWLIEDNCDALGSIYSYDGIEKKTGTIGDIGTSSFYPPHHITMGEGGAVVTDNPLLYKIINSFRDWGRDCVCNSGQDNLCKNRFKKQYGKLPQGYDHKYVYSHFGYNLKATEMQAAIGVAQLKKIESFVEMRRANFDYLNSKLSDLQSEIILPIATENSKPSWFGYLITVKDIEDRNKLVKFLEERNIQTRMLFASNMILHPCFTQMSETEGEYRVIGDLANTNMVLYNSFWIGVSPKMTNEMLDYMAESIHIFFQNKKDGEM
ncbi:MAG: lipopolysaccharide biosynthesis protein RfbH [Bacilli bacterium]|uniref:lipopolysaccharide biosynthesis protein RfbH n=1 Tax=Anaerorhabdus sp. TaxID=1872524 RepID=UPI002FC97632